jgi:non-specific serine/threonine protein kinase/serine/threonine-protein kinase
MDHPNIAKVLDAGSTESGRPYFVMDLVKGIPITQYCDEARLNLRERLELFIPVCAAIQHAHQKGIIHRDVKPSNVLVTLIDGKPVPKVIDFGVAKATDQRLTERTMFTEFGAIVGTPEYMSPEQAELSGLDVDTRSDIFSLGVLLYELLTGSTPLERARLREAGYAEIMRRIKEEEPPKPSTRISHSGDRLASIAATRGTEPARLTRLVRGELDWIVMKALEKERSRRYETAIGFARDIERYLAGDPVEAGPPSASYRIRKFARKHRAGLAAASAFALMLIAATIVSAYLAVRATRAERAAREQGAIAQAVNDFLQQDLLGQADADNQAMLGEKPDPEIKVRTLLDRAAAKIEGRFKDQPAVEASIRRTIGGTYLCMGLPSLAEAHLAQSLALARRDLGDRHETTLNLMASMAFLHACQANYATAESLYTDAMDGLEHVQGRNHRDTLSAMVGLGQVLTGAGKFAQADSLFSRAVDACREVLGEGDRTTLLARLQLAHLAGFTGKFAEGQHQAERVAEMAREGSGDRIVWLWGAMGFLAILNSERGLYDQADRLSTEALDRCIGIYGPDFFRTYTHMAHRALLLARVGKTEEAGVLLNRAMAGARRSIEKDHDFICWIRALLGETYQAQGRLVEAERLYKEATDGWTRTLGRGYYGRLSGMIPLIELYVDEGRLETAGEWFTEAQLVADGLDDEGLYVADTETALARLRVLQGKWNDAEPLARRALAIRLDRHPDLWYRYDALSLLGAALAGQGKHAEAEPLLVEAYEGLKERQERIPFLWRKKRPAEAAWRLVELYDAWSKKDQADQWRQRWILDAELPTNPFAP